MNGDVLGSSAPDEEQDHGHWSWPLVPEGRRRWGTSLSPTPGLILQLSGTHAKGYEIDNHSGSQRERDQVGTEPVHQATMALESGMHLSAFSSFICTF